MKTRLALFAIFTALMLSAFGASPASPAADPENFQVSLRVTLVSCEGGNLPDCSFEGSAVVPQLGRATVTGHIIKGCVGGLDFCESKFDLYILFDTSKKSSVLFEHVLNILASLSKSLA